ncbi:DUF6101 family protein [Chelatococcus sp. CO-6]|uniref:DUF6101 family protein n=2 Tax=unclassified Chelatococcus TaxID=2638111 RepID=UPI00069FE064|nr:DUF6101 family protein [Chelatococcus sp. CO-6]
MAAGKNSAAGAGCHVQPAAGEAISFNDIVMRLPGARVILPGAAGTFAGVAVRFVPEEGDAEMFELVLVGHDRRRDLVIGRWDDGDIAAVWRSVAATSGLPLLLEREDGVIVCPRPQIGRLQLGEIRIRRRHGLLNGRRPRFLVRRKTGKPLMRPVRVHGRDMMARD